MTKLEKWINETTWIEKLYATIKACKSDWHKGYLQGYAAALKDTNTITQQEYDEFMIDFRNKM